MELYKNKFRTTSVRLQTWDYSQEGTYFITICTKDRTHYFGHIQNGKMVLSKIGIIADLMWYECIKHAKNIELCEFVVMPNHIHGIIILHGGNGSIVKNTGATRFQNQGKNSISSIIGGYKAAVTKHANRLGLKFHWHSLFYEHIIRDERAYQTIRAYIKNNPLRWQEDKFNKKEKP